MGFMKRIAIAGILIATTLVGATSGQTNFIFFLSDDQLRADYGCYGFPTNQVDLTPVTDQLASEGLVFDQMHTTEAICAPSRASLFTGMYPIRHGLFLNHSQARTGTATVYDALKPLGYDVALAGKVHVRPDSVFQWDTTIATLPNPTNGSPAILDMPAISNYLANTTEPFCLFITSSFPHPPYPTNPDFPANQTVVHPHQTSVSAGYYDNIAFKEQELEKGVRPPKSS